LTVRAISTAAPAHTTRITFVRNTNRIEIRNDITQNFGSVKTWAFSFNLDTPDVRHEEVGAVIRAKLLADGGNYSPANARYDWLTMNHFADVSSNNGGANTVGVTVSNADDYYMKLGNSTNLTLDVNTPQLNVLAGGQVDGANLGIQNQGGDSLFMQRFALRTHDAFDKTAAMKFALEHQNPFAAGEVTGTNALSPKSEPQNSIYNGSNFSFASISNPNVLLWALKPAEDGISRGIVVRVWNMSDAPGNYNFSLAENISSAKRVTHIETDITDATVSNGQLIAAANGNQIQSHRVMILAPTAAGTDISGRVLLRGRRGLGKVKVTLFNSATQTMLETRTNGNGYFYFTNVAAGGTVIVGVSKTGYTFKPAEQVFNNLDSRSDVEFTANYRGL
jgi:alpha-mannosidase